MTLRIFGRTWSFDHSASEIPRIRRILAEVGISKLRNEQTWSSSGVPTWKNESAPRLTTCGETFENISANNFRHTDNSAGPVNRWKLFSLLCKNPWIGYSRWVTSKTSTFIMPTSADLALDTPTTAHTQVVAWNPRSNRSLPCMDHAPAKVTSAACRSTTTSSRSWKNSSILFVGVRTPWKWSLLVKPSC